jgi:hypothetical protein
LLDASRVSGDNDEVSQFPSRRVLSTALLLALMLPAIVTTAIVVHEAGHHRHDEATGQYLVVAVHGHHHDRDVEAHDHEAVTTKSPASSTIGRLVGSRMPGERWVDVAAAGQVHAIAAALPVTRGSSDLCIWQL